MNSPISSRPPSCGQVIDSPLPIERGKSIEPGTTSNEGGRGAGAAGGGGGLPSFQQIPSFSTSLRLHSSSMVTLSPTLGGGNNSNVSFPTIANFALKSTFPLPFPASEHPLPPPSSTSNYQASGSSVGWAEGPPLPSTPQRVSLPPPPPPPQQLQADSTVVQSPQQLLTPRTSSASTGSHYTPPPPHPAQLHPHPLVLVPLPAPPPPPLPISNAPTDELPSPTSPASSYYTPITPAPPLPPLQLQTQQLGQAMAPSFSPPPPPQPQYGYNPYLATGAAGGLGWPGGNGGQYPNFFQQQQLLTPWPPVPLPHIDDFLAVPPQQLPQSYGYPISSPMSNNGGGANYPHGLSTFSTTQFGPMASSGGQGGNGGGGSYAHNFSPSSATEFAPSSPPPLPFVPLPIPLPLAVPPAPPALPVPMPPQQQSDPSLSAVPFDASPPRQQSFPPVSTVPFDTSPPSPSPPSSSQPAPSVPASSYGPTHVPPTTAEGQEGPAGMGLGTCFVKGCAAVAACELSPCKCSLCRDHLGWVLRGGVEIAPTPPPTVRSPPRSKSDPLPPPTTPHKPKKLFKCVSCGRQSIMQHTPTKSALSDHDKPSTPISPSPSLPSPSPSSRSYSRAEVEAFSISYFSAGPAPTLGSSSSPEANDEGLEEEERQSQVAEMQRRREESVGQQYAFDPAAPPSTSPTNPPPLSHLGTASTLVARPPSPPYPHLTSAGIGLGLQMGVVGGEEEGNDEYGAPPHFLLPSFQQQQQAQQLEDDIEYPISSRGSFSGPGGRADSTFSTSHHLLPLTPAVLPSSSRPRTATAVTPSPSVARVASNLARVSSLSATQDAVAMEIVKTRLRSQTAPTLVSYVEGRTREGERRERSTPMPAGEPRTPPSYSRPESFSPPANPGDDGYASSSTPSVSSSPSYPSYQPQLYSSSYPFYSSTTSPSSSFRFPYRGSYHNHGPQSSPPPAPASNVLGAGGVSYGYAPGYSPWSTSTAAASYGFDTRSSASAAATAGALLRPARGGFATRGGGRGGGGTGMGRRMTLPAGAVAGFYSTAVGEGGAEGSAVATTSTFFPSPYHVGRGRGGEGDGAALPKKPEFLLGAGVGRGRGGYPSPPFPRTAPPGSLAGRSAPSVFGTDEGGAGGRPSAAAKGLQPASLYAPREAPAEEGDASGGNGEGEEGEEGDQSGGSGASEAARQWRGRWPIVKVENIPFNTRLEDVLDWLPAGYLASPDEVVMPVHLVLHRATGRTLPHCYLETVSISRAQHLIDTMDRSQLGDRTVRVKWERPGELMRDFFSQEVFFQNPFGAERSPAAAPLPHLPADGYRMPSVLLRRQDLDRLISFCQKPIQFRERPFERAFYNMVSIIAKFPWSRTDLWDVELRDAIFTAAEDIAGRAQVFSAVNALFRDVLDKLVGIVLDTEAFTEVQKDSMHQFAPAVEAPSKPSRSLVASSTPSDAPHSPTTPRTPPLTLNRSLSMSPPPVTPTRSRIPSKGIGIVSLSAFARTDDEGSSSKDYGDVYPPSPPHYRSLPPRKASGAEAGETTKGAEWLSAAPSAGGSVASSSSGTPAMVPSRTGSRTNANLEFPSLPLGTTTASPLPVAQPSPLPPPTREDSVRPSSSTGVVPVLSTPPETPPSSPEFPRRDGKTSGRALQGWASNAV